MREWWLALAGVLILAALFSRGIVAVAVECYRRMVGTLYRWDRSHRAADAYVRGDPDKALRMALRALRRHPTDDNAAELAVRVLVETGRVQEAVRLAEETLPRLSMPGLPALTLARAFYEAGDVDRARHWYARARRDPHFSLYLRLDVDGAILGTRFEEAESEELGKSYT